MNVNVNVKRLHEDAKIPEYATKGSSGFDLKAIESVYFAPGETKLIRTGLAVDLPEGYEIQIRPRSGVSLKTMLRISNAPGTIDEDYKGEIKIIVTNMGDFPFVIHEGAEIAQGVLNRVPKAIFNEVNELSESERGEGGFGSTDKEGS